MLILYTSRTVPWRHLGMFNGKTKAHLVCFLTDIIMIRLSCKAVVKNAWKTHLEGLETREPWPYRYEPGHRTKVL